MLQKDAFAKVFIALHIRHEIIYCKIIVVKLFKLATMIFTFCIRYFALEWFSIVAEEKKTTIRREKNPTGNRIRIRIHISNHKTKRSPWVFHNLFGKFANCKIQIAHFTVCISPFLGVFDGVWHVVLYNLNSTTGYNVKNVNDNDLSIYFMCFIQVHWVFNGKMFSMKPEFSLVIFEMHSKNRQKHT